MAGSNNFLQFNPNKLNQSSDSTYSVSSYRINGIPAVPSVAPSSLHNKLFYQTTTMATAIGQVFANRGFLVSDDDLNGLISILDKIVSLDNNGDLKSGSSGGNAATATKLKTARKISGVDFDGSKDIVVPNVPAGTVIYTASSAAPDGYLKANGEAVSRTTYAELFAAIGTRFGNGDGSTTFHLPDLRGEFIRGWDDGRGVDPVRTIGTAQGSQNLSHSHGGGTGGAGSHSHSASTSADGSHSHYVSDFASIPTNSYNSYELLLTESTTLGYQGRLNTESAGTHSHSVSIEGNGYHNHGIGSDGGTEARPRNIALLACIKF